MVFRKIALHEEAKFMLPPPTTLGMSNDDDGFLHYSLLTSISDVGMSVAMQQA